MYELPIFPLNTVLFPGMPLRLHIFEERYKIMLQQVLQTNQTFGVCLIKSGAEAFGPTPEPYHTGCTARIVEVEPLDDGRANLTAVGDERFRILKIGPAAPYLSAFVESAPLASHHTLEVVRAVRTLRGRVPQYLALLAALSGREAAGQETEDEPGIDLTGIQLPEDTMSLIYFSASLLQIPAIEKQPILEAETAAAMLQQIQRLLRRELAVLPPLIKISPERARISAWMN